MSLRLKNFPKKSALEAIIQDYPSANVQTIEAVHWIFRFSSEFEKALEFHFNSFGISRCRFIVLMLLSKHPEKQMSPSELADELDVTRGNVTGVITTLEKDGYVTRMFDSSDRRSSKIKLSKKGDALLKKLLPVHFNRIANVFKELSGEEQQTIVKLFTKLEKRLHFLKEPS